MTSLPVWHSDFITFALHRYEDLIRWAKAVLSAQGLDEDAVSQTLLRLSQPIEMEHVRREMGGSQEEERENSQEEEEQREEEACPHTKRPRLGSRRTCRYGGSIQDQTVQLVTTRWHRILKTALNVNI